MRRVLLPVLAALVAAGCTSESSSLGLGEGPDAGGARPSDAGPAADAGLACEQLDEDGCDAPGCARHYCNGCFGREFFAACYSGEMPDCPDPDCPESCSILDEDACLGVGDNCRADYCPFCPGQVFVGCSRPVDPPPACPPVACPCDGLDEGACRAEGECHGVYAYDEPCLCDAPGCCMRFERCAEGRYTDCEGADLLCEITPPFCDPPFVVSFEGICYEGCVRPDACGP